MFHLNRESSTKNGELKMDCLPENLSEERYISSCLALINKWKWLWEERNVDILQAGILDNSPASEILPYLSTLKVNDLNEVPYGFIKDDWPDEMKKFVKECCFLKLYLPKLEITNDIELDPNLFRNMNRKKQVEVKNFSAMIYNICIRNNIRHVVDFGSGLGYVDRILTQQYGLSVLGIEKNKNNVRKARELGGGVDYMEAYVSEETIPDVKQIIEDWLQGCPVCFISLHGCGDLSIQLGVLYGEIEAPKKLLILIPCCYHRSTLRPLTPRVVESGLVSHRLLRLASESTAERWRLTSPEQHLAHARSVLARAIIQLFLANDNETVQKKCRHLFRKATREDWDKCFLRSVEEFNGVDAEKLKVAWKENEWRLNQIESYSCLQVCLQAVAEGLVLMDTFLFLKAVTGAEVNIVRLFDPVTSPRSVAFVVLR